MSLRETLLKWTPNVSILGVPKPVQIGVPKSDN